MQYVDAGLRYLKAPRYLLRLSKKQSPSISSFLIFFFINPPKSTYYTCENESPGKCQVCGTKAKQFFKVG